MTPMAGDDDVAVIMKQRTRAPLGVDDSQLLSLLAVWYGSDKAATDYWQPECGKTGWRQPSRFEMFYRKYAVNREVLGKNKSGSRSVSSTSSLSVPRLVAQEPSRGRRFIPVGPGR